MGSDLVKESARSRYGIITKIFCVNLISKEIDFYQKNLMDLIDSEK